jgi:thymidylate synthase (FAD)
MNDTVIDATNPRWVKCLDHGFIHLVDSMGNDQRIVDAARVSYQQGTKAVQSDRHLIRYLLRNLHTTPFEKVVFEFHIKCPIYIARQWMRHRTSSYNEISARYSVMKDEFYIPNPVRKQSETNRQGSSNEIVTMIPLGGPVTADAQTFYSQVTKASYDDYENLLNAGVARELARGVLPTSLYTEFYWTVNLWNLMHFLKLRLDKHAQFEIRVFAEAIYKILKDNCDIQYALEAFQDYILDDPKLSKYELEIINQFIEAKRPTIQRQDDIETLQALINANPLMSKREKEESRLVDLLFPELSIPLVDKETFTDS